MKEHFLIYLLLSFFLTACNPVRFPDSGSSWDASKYTVQNGDTLYSIAWRYELDFRDIAKWNKITDPYLISPGQRLMMRQPVIEPEDKEYLFGGNSQALLSEPEQTQEEQPVHSLDYSQALTIPPPPLDKSQPVPASKQTTRTVKSVPIYNQKKSNTSVISQTANKESYKKNKSSSDTAKWSWPVKGKVVSTFASNNHDRKGIDIKGRPGEQVRAANSGVVVYSGSGLISYGKLIIIKHNELFLSAYAYNKKLLVKEGTRVNKDQTIAIIGKNANVTNLLHFEIRKDGKPVNPLLYLP
ncbi:MAG: peptidoglycan DD-metalloendopeptidase family protein [Gammaproteobacteria bacterium]|nr:peptidoglycan DD-metalloendopeptidase family protein [Gammaproteobacteria bacterium]